MEHSATPVREVTLDEAVSIAIQLQRNQQLAEAGDLYRRILERVPDHPAALHYSGVLAHQQGRSDQGLALIERSLELEPGQADWHNNLGIVLQNRGTLDDAIVAYQRAIALDPNHANAHNNLGVLLRALGRSVEAEAAYRTAIRLSPDHVDAHINLGVLLNGLNRAREAYLCFCRVTTLRPKHAEGRRLLALAHYSLGEVDKAAKIFEEWLDEEPEEPIAQHMFAACSGRDVPARASDGFVEKTFDNFAARFDAKLANLSYRAPALVAAMLEDLKIEATKSLDVLDAGCGTGLCGPLVAPFARHLIGVDLSGSMLARARERNVYDDLVKSELTTYLRGCKEAFDVIVSADTLVYFGALEDVFSAAAEALRANGSLIFTLEKATDGLATYDYRLEPHGRYTHARGYVERLLGQLGLSAEVVPADLRMEAGAPVSGLVVRAIKRKTLSGIRD